MLSLSEMIAEVEEWLNKFAYNASISRVIQISDWEYDVYRITFEEGIEADEDELTVYSNGVIKNANDEDVIKVALSAYDNDKDILKWIENFEGKWRDSV